MHFNSISEVIYLSQGEFQLCQGLIIYDILIFWLFHIVYLKRCLKFKQNSAVDAKNIAEIFPTKDLVLHTMWSQYKWSIEFYHVEWVARNAFIKLD